MIDIHSHILPMVDDGSFSVEKSIEMLKTAMAEGVTDVILTPHYRNKYKLNKEEAEEKFKKFCNIVKNEGIKVNLYLGQEIFQCKDIRKLLENKEICTLNGSKYILFELDYNYSEDLTEIVYELNLAGYVTIFAHIERYPFVKLEDVASLREMGALFQVNAEGLVGLNGGRIKKVVKRLLKNDYVDFVASDYHENREYSMKKAFEYVSKKYGVNRANKIFIENQKKILKGSD